MFSPQEIVLVEGSRVFDSWKTPPPPVYMEFFFFNVTNVKEFLEGTKPEVEQVGPYTYRYGNGMWNHVFVIIIISSEYAKLQPRKTKTMINRVSLR